MKNASVSALLLALNCSISSAYGQEALGSTSENPEVCELAVYPAGSFPIEVETWSEILGGGAIAAIADAAYPKKALHDFLADTFSPDRQLSALSALGYTSKLGFGENVKVIIHDPLLGDGDVNKNPKLKGQIIDLVSTTKLGKRLSNSANGCYAELIMTNIRFVKHALHGPKIAVAFWLRDFRRGVTQPIEVKGLEQTQLQGNQGPFSVNSDEAKAASLKAFSDAFSDWWAKKPQHF